MVGGTQVAVFRVEWCLTPFDAGSSEAVLAIEDLDPFSGAAVLSRGIVGDVDGEPVVASPVYKQRFSLHTGACLDDPTVTVRTWDARIREGRIEVAVWCRPSRSSCAAATSHGPPPPRRRSD